MVRLVRESDYIGLGPDDAVAQAASPSFDAATFEIWGALLNGARLVMVSRAVLLSPRELERTLAEHEVTTLFLTTALFNQVARERPGAFGSLRHLLFGGEAADAEAARRVLASGAPPQRLIHVYGPTENTTFSTWHSVLQVPPDATTLPIGRPIANSTAWVLDGCGRIQPLGVWGELHVGGAGVATGYLGGGTDESVRFLPDPFSSRPGARLYRTGDRARWTLEGELEFGGRLDAQVKLRGFRIEPAEVEGALRRCPGVVEAAVVVHGVGRERRLVAYVAGAEEIQGGQIRDQVRHRLPPYMVPSTVVVMPALPLTASGKLDRHALPAPTELSPPPTARPAGDPLEREIAAIWRTLLGKDSVGARESFFDLGGHSLLALEMIRRVEVATGREVGVDVLFEEPTIAHLARTIARAERSGGCPVVELRTGEAGVAPFFFFHGDFNGAGLYTRNLVESLDQAQPVYIVHPHQPGGPASIQDMAEDLLPALRSVRPRGPYLLGGHCNGGAVAFEVAQRLLAAGECVELLVLVDVPGRNIGLAPYATLLERVGRALHVPAARRHALFLATRGPVERLVYGLNTAAERAPGRVRRARAAVLVAWAADQTRRAGARLLRAAILRGGGEGAAEGHPGPVSERAERARYFAAAMQSYLPTHYAGRLVLITPAEPGSIPAWLRPELWARLCDSVEIRPVAGDHLSVLTEDIEPLGAVLGDLLRGPAHTVGA